MSIRIRISQTTGNTTLAIHDLPDGSQARLQAAWAGGPGTAAENALKFMLAALHAETKARSRIAATADELAAYHAAKATEDTGFETDFPAP